METCSRIVNDKKFSILLQKGTIFDTWKWESTKIDRNNKCIWGCYRSQNKNSAYCNGIEINNYKTCNVGEIAIFGSNWSTINWNRSHIPDVYVDFNVGNEIKKLDLRWKLTYLIKSVVNDSSYILIIRF